MSAPRHPSLRRKLLGLAVACSLIALGATALALGAFEWYSFRGATVAHLDSVGTLIARTSSAALAFEDREDARRILSALETEPAVERAVLFDEDGRPFADYVRPGSTQTLPARPPPDGVTLTRTHARLVVPVVEQKRFGTLLVEADIRAVGARVFAYSLVLLGTTLASVVIALFLTRRLVRRISDPVKALAAAAAAVQTGHEPLRPVPKPEDDELGTLTEAFNAMLDRIKRKEAERHRAELHVVESERRFRAVAEKAPALIWSCDEQLERDYSNATWLAFTGRSAEQERGLGWQGGLPPEDLERWRSAALAASARLEPYTVEYRLRRSDGALRWLVENASPRFRADGAFAGYLGSCIDITPGKENEAELEERVRRRTRQLEAVNKELESFSYSVSHDLRAPVRLIGGYAEIALEECEAGRAEGAVTPLRSVLRSAARMNQLIDAFLSLARITRAELHVEEVDLSRLAADVIEVLRITDRSREVSVEIAPGLRCRGDARLLRIALDNLLGNAWKFTARKPGARIQFGEETQDGERVFFVRDNGAGFKAAFTDKLFQVFGRLHSANEFEGLGVGLNTVHRIVQRHEGRVWARGAEGEGATFYFTLPGPGGDPV